MRSRKRRRKVKSGRLIALLVVAGLLAVGCGWLINRLVVQGYLWTPTVVEGDPVGQNPPTDDPGPGDEQQQTPPAVTQAEATLRAFRFYLVQVGALSSQNSAANLVQQLAEQGYPGAYAREGNLYRVYAGIYPEKEAAQAVSQMLRPGYPDAFVKEMALSGGDFSVTGGLAGYFATADDQLATIDTVFNDCLAATAIDQARATNLKQQVDAAHEALSALDPPQELASFHTALLEACTQLLATANQLSSYLESNNELDLISAEGSLMNFAIDYQEVHSIIHNILT